jgi:elongation factor 1 alpha-like protein
VGRLTVDSSPRKKTDNKKDIERLAKDVQAVDLDTTANEATEPTTKSQTKKHTLDEIKEQLKLRESPTISFVIIGIPCISHLIVGHVDAGKSTLMGRLLYDLHAVDERTMQKYRQESQKAGKASFALAWVMDQSEEERKRYEIPKFNQANKLRV